MQEVKQSEVNSKKSGIRCTTCGNDAYFWRDAGRMKCQICGDFVDHLI